MTADAEMGGGGAPLGLRRNSTALFMAGDDASLDETSAASAVSASTSSTLTVSPRRPWRVAVAIAVVVVAVAVGAVVSLPVAVDDGCEVSFFAEALVRAMCGEERGRRKRSPREGYSLLLLLLLLVVGGREERRCQTQ
jgi:hypothetical protein